MMPANVNKENARRVPDSVHASRTGCAWLALLRPHSQRAPSRCCGRSWIRAAHTRTPLQASRGMTPAGHHTLGVHSSRLGPLRASVSPWLLRLFAPQQSSLVNKFPVPPCRAFLPRRHRSAERISVWIQVIRRSKRPTPRPKLVRALLMPSSRGCRPRPEKRFGTAFQGEEELSPAGCSPGVTRSPCAFLCSADKAEQVECLQTTR